MARIYYVHTPDADARLSRALDIILDAATRITPDHKNSVVYGKKPTKVGRPKKEDKETITRKCCYSKINKGGEA